MIDTNKINNLIEFEEELDILRNIYDNHCKNTNYKDNKNFSNEFWTFTTMLLCSLSKYNILYESAIDKFYLLIKKRFNNSNDCLLDFLLNFIDEIDYSRMSEYKLNIFFNLNKNIFFQNEERIIKIIPFIKINDNIIEIIIKNISWLTKNINELQLNEYNIFLYKSFWNGIICKQQNVKIIQRYPNVFNNKELLFKLRLSNIFFQCSEAFVRKINIKYKELINENS